MVVGSDHGAVDDLELVGRKLGLAQGTQGVLPQHGARPAPELPVDSGPLAKLFWQVPPGRTGPRDPKKCHLEQADDPQAGAHSDAELLG